MRGCYGLGFEGVSGADGLLSDVPDRAPLLSVHVQSPAVDLDVEHVGPDSAAFRLQGGGSVMVERRGGTATLRMPDAAEVPHEHLVHPFLSTSVAVVSRWSGRDTFHAGAFVTERGAWVVIGDKGQGKSTLLAEMAMRGRVVLSDDLVVVDDGEILCGPRCIDLRIDAAAQLARGEDLGVVGARHRARLRLDPAPISVPLCGWVALGWGDDIRTTRMEVKERIPALLNSVALRMPPLSPSRFLEYATLPFIFLRRPRDWSVADESIAAIMEQVDSA